MKRSAALFAFAVLALAPSAHAVPEYPPEIRRSLSLSYEPPCRICHIQGITGAGTLQTGFAMSMRARGLNGDERSSVTTALQRMKQDGVDSDGDGVTDVAELVAGTDPNSPSPDARLDSDAPNNGCGFGRASGGGVFAGVLLMFAVTRSRASAHRRARAERRSS